MTLEAEAPPSAQVNCYFFRAYVSWRSQELGCICTRWDDHTFSLSPITSPGACGTWAFFQEPCVCGRQSSTLGCELRHLRVWIAAHWPPKLVCYLFEHSQGLADAGEVFRLPEDVQFLASSVTVRVTWDVNEQPWGYLNMGAGSLGMTKHSANLGV